MTNKLQADGAVCDLPEMTYSELLRRMLELMCVIRDSRFVISLSGLYCMGSACVATHWNAI